MSKKRKSYEPYCKEGTPPSDVMNFLSAEPSSPDLDELRGLRCSIAYVANRSSKQFSPLNGVRVRAVVLNLLSSHNEVKQKDVHGIVPGRCEKYLAKAHVKEVHALIYDIDGGLDLYQVRQALRRFGHSAQLLSSYNHRITTTKIRNVRASGEALTDEEAIAHCASTKKHRWLRNVRVVNDGQAELDEKGSFYLVEHDPVDKLRVYIFISTPIIIAQVGHVVFAALYHALGGQLFGDAYDAACGHANRIFYLPSKPIGSQVEHIAEHFSGPVYDWRELGKQIEDDVETRRAASEERARKFANRDRNVGLTDLAEALRRIPPEDYHEWFVALAVIHHETEGSEEGLALAHEWSALSPEQYDPEAVDSRWDAFFDSSYEGERATFGTLVYLARRYDPSFRRRVEDQEPPMSHINFK